MSISWTFGGVVATNFADFGKSHRSLRMWSCPYINVASAIWVFSLTFCTQVHF